MKFFLSQVFGIYTISVVAISPQQWQQRQQHALVGADMTVTHNDRVPGHSDATYSVVPVDDQLFEVEFLEVAPTPIRAYVAQESSQPPSTPLFPWVQLTDTSSRPAIGFSLPISAGTYPNTKRIALTIPLTGSTRQQSRSAAVLSTRKATARTTSPSSSRSRR